MNNIESHVTSLELSRKLCELGVKQSSFFYWTTGGVVYRGDMPFYIDTNYSAFLASELGVMLPVEFYCNDWNELLKLSYWKPLGDEWEVCTIYQGGKGIYHQKSKTEPDSRAKMLIYLIENGIVKVSE